MMTGGGGRPASSLGPSSSVFSFLNASLGLLLLTLSHLLSILPLSPHPFNLTLKLPDMVLRSTPVPVSLRCNNIHSG